MMEVAGLKNWLQSLELSEYYDYFRPMGFDQIMRLNKRQIYYNLSPDLVDHVIDSLQLVKNQELLIKSMNKKVLGEENINFVLTALEGVLPNQFEALLGRIPTILVDIVRLIYNRLDNLKPLEYKQKCQYHFCTLCLRMELCESFTEADKECLRKWRVEHEAAIRFHLEPPKISCR